MTWAITGTGMVSCLGNGVAGSFAAYCAGRSGLRRLQSFDRSRYRVRRAYEVRDRRGRTDVPGRASRWLCDAIGQAVERAGLAGPAGRVPVLIGTGLAEQRSVELWWTAGAPLALEELHFAGAVGRRFTPLWTTTLVNACSAGLYALALGTDLLRVGDAEAVVVAATDAITESMFGLLDRVTAQPPARVRPFDEDRRGVILGEGAAAVVVEPIGRARTRGVPVMAVLRGVGTSCDAHHVTAPLREGIGRAMRDAHDRAGVAPGQIDLVLAHGTGTMLNDEAEARALREVYAGAARRPVVTSLKSLIGHTSGASGLMSLVTAVEAMASGRVPPTLHHRRTIAALQGFRVAANQALPTAVRTAQVNAFGFGGVNAVAVLGRPSTRAGSPARPVRSPSIVVTGLGSAGPGVPPPDQLLAGACRPLAPFEPRAILGRHGLRYKDRATVLALCAVAHAFADAGLPAGRAARSGPDSFGVVVSSTLAVVDTVCRTAATVRSDGTAATSAMDLPNASGNAAAAAVAIWYGLAGLNLTVSAGPCSGLSAIYLAAAALRAGRASRIVVVGVEPGGEAAGRLIRDTAARHGVDPAGVRPFDGAAAVVVESRDAAEERGARIRAVVGEYGQHPDLARTVALALRPSPGMPHPGLWLAPCSAHPATADRVDALELAGRAERVDLSALTGEAAGALGVLQCAAAAAWLADRPAHRALLSGGGCWGESYASLTLRGDS